jgi:hypothetical protein
MALAEWVVYPCSSMLDGARFALVHSAISHVDSFITSAVIALQALNPL